MTSSSVWADIGPYLVTCPSPHNTQPFRLRVSGDRTADVIFLPRRGLPVADPEGRFTWLTAGIFIEIIAIAAHALGYELEQKTDFSPMYRGGDTKTPQVISRLKLVPAGGPVSDLDADLILQRHTSRLPYDGKAIPSSLIVEMQAEARRTGHAFDTRNDPKSIAWVVEINRQSLFHDMGNAAVRNELIHWLRFGTREEAITNDGLSARCLGFSATLLKNLFTQHKFWLLPGIKDALGLFYKRSMTGIGTIGWLRGPYGTNQDWMSAGSTMFRLWLIVTKHGFYWHPYGSVITSEEARTNMIKYLDMPAETGGEMVWLLLRLGKSPMPPRSHRLPLEDVILWN